MKTAVEWYSNAVNDILIARQHNKIDDELLIQNLLNAKLQAKAMEKEHIMNVLIGLGWTSEKAEQYYTETFKSE
jgi:hypothetical protein